MARGKLRPGHPPSPARWFTPPAANGSQTGEGNNQRGVQQVPANVKTAAPATQRAMVFKSKTGSEGGAT